MWLEVDDVDALCAQARAAGAAVAGDPVTQDYGYRTFRVVDPEGHRWYIGSRAAAPPAYDGGAAAGRRADSNL